MTTPTLESLRSDPNALARHYSRFDVAGRLLFTGHSHQAWPDRGFAGHTRAWEDAARLVDQKWDEAFERADRVRNGFARLLGTAEHPDDGDFALGVNTHELVLRFLSATAIVERPRLVTTDGEFHSIRRQLTRLEEAGVTVDRLPVDPVETLSERLAAAVTDRTAAALVSVVMFRDARIVPGLDRLAERCAHVGAELLVDTYHALNVMPYDLREWGLSGAFVVGGGYKYCQLGEGNCFLRVPPGCTLRPAITGWFAEFSALADAAGDHRVAYGAGAERFAGSTYDPTSHYRAAEVFDFFEETGLNPGFLRDVSRHQIDRLARGFDDLDLDPAVIRRDTATPLREVGGFLALQTPVAKALYDGLLQRGVLTDFRDDILRFGPAPYLCDRQIGDALAGLGEAVAALPG